MITKAKTKRSLDQVFVEYTKNRDFYHAAHRNGDPVSGNKYVDRMWKVEIILRHELGQAGREKLVSLLNDQDRRVRMSAAGSTIDFAEARATRVLEEIEAANIRWESMEAHYCLKNWREGISQLPGGLVTLEPGENYPAFNELH